jgi:adenylate kinase family enzyme
MARWQAAGRPDPAAEHGCVVEPGWLASQLMERVWVVGNSGSGKSTLARRIATAIGAHHTELDAIFHQPGWTELPRDEFRRRVDGVVRGPRWVVDGNYAAVADLVRARANTVVWIDLPRWRVMHQLGVRTLRRGVRRTELWNGNRETLRNFFSLDKEKSILMWAWTQHGEYRRRYLELLESAPAGLRIVRLQTPAAVEAFPDRSAAVAVPPATYGST